MKTIVERAYDYADEKWGDIDEYHADTVAVSAYIAGAEEQKRIAIEKACEYLDIYFMEIGYPDDWMRDSPNMLSGEERFRKAMEE